MACPKRLRSLMLHIREYIHQHCGNRHTSAVVGVGFALWQAWATQDGSALPSGMRLSQPALDANGQPSTTHSAVFERGVSSKAEPGHGIGLALVRKTLDALQGTITIEATAQGSCVVCYIPKEV